jgi:hypothetical protein
MCESVPRYVKRRYYMHAAARRGGFTARWEIRTRDVRVTRLGDARRRVVCVRRRWRRERLSERGESETAESRESRTRSSRHATDESQSDQSPHQCVSKMCLSGLRRGPSCHVEHNVDMLIMNVECRWSASARAAWSRDAGTGLECAVSVCTERTDTESENGLPNFLFQEPDTARACVPPPRLQCAMRMSIHTEGLHVDDHLVVFAWPRGPCGCVSGWRSRAHV